MPLRALPVRERPPRSGARVPRGLLLQRPRPGRTGAEASPDFRQAPSRCRPAHALPADAIAAGRRIPRRQPQLLEVGVPGATARRGDRHPGRPCEPGALPADRDCGVEYYGGAASRVETSETAFAHRAAEYDIGALTQWTDPADSKRNIEWIRSLSDALQPFATGAYLLNLLGEEDHKTIRAAFGPNYDRLRVVKKKYDPTNVFRINQNIEPAA